MLYDSLLPERKELIEVKSKSGKDHLYVHPRHRGNQYVSGFEYPFNYCIVPLNGCSLLADSEIPQLIHDAERMISSTSFHRCGIAPGYCAVITTISVCDFSLFGEVHLAVMSRCSGRFELANEAVLHVQLSVELVAKIGFAALLYPRAIFASTRLRFLTTRLIRLRMPGIRGDKSRILSNSLFYLQAKSIELSLEFRPDRLILTGLRQPLIGNTIRS